MKKLLLVLLVIFSFSLNAKIIEIKNIKEIHNYTKDVELVVFDLDNTLIETVQQLGSDQWFFHSIQHYIKEGLSKKEAFENVFRKWIGIQYLTEVKLVENDTETVISDLKQKNIKLLGLTVRGPEMIFATFKQLEDVKLNLSEASIFSNQFFMADFDKVYCQDGFLFTNGSNKGKVLLAFFQKINYFPKSLIFVDDKGSHLKDVEELCKKNNIEFIGLRYSYLDEKINNFDKEISDIQFNHFYNILSDEEAKALKK